MKMFKEKHIKKVMLPVTDKNAPMTYVESYRSLCTNLEFITAAQKCKSIMIVSSLANEGKTNTCVNLALTLSSYGKKVCVVECDLRKPSLHRFISAKHNSDGLTNILKGEIEFEDAVRHVTDTNVSILLAGVIPPNPSELLASDKMKKFIVELEDKFDYIIYDTAPAFVVADAIVLGKNLDGAILVIKHADTEKSIVSKVKRNLENSGINILGAILSQFNDEASGSTNNSYYYYYGGYGGSPEKK